MALRVEWLDQHRQLPKHSALIFALPGVGNVGKVALESLVNLGESYHVARLHPIGLPPIAKLDEDGLLTPPHYSLQVTYAATGELPILTLCGSSQPTDPMAQAILAHELMGFLNEQSVHTIIVLAGMADTPERKETFVVASSSAHRVDLEQQGVNVRRDEPRSGAIGVAALMASLGPIYNINSCCAISTTLGSSGDARASHRLLQAVNQWFNLGFQIPENDHSWIRERLEVMAPVERDDLVAEMTNSHDGFYM